MASNGIGKGKWIIGGVALAALWFLLCRHLSGEWSVNEQYSYGWFVPFFAAFLFWLRWEDRPRTGGRTPEVGGRRAIASGIAIVALVALAPVRLFEVANPDWRPLSWVHAAAVIAVTLVVIWFAGGTQWVRHFAFPVLFFFVAVPWISPIEEPIVQGLMRIVAAVATEAIGIFGIPAQLEGSLIRVNTGLVGVNEACSGVRSLQTSLMIGLLFGELKRFSVARRFALVLGAMGLAILANFGRALFLVWIAATRGTNAVAEWHDIAGYAIVALVFLGSLGLTAALGKRGKPKAGERRPEIGERKAVTSGFRPATSALLGSLAWLIAIEVGVEAWYRTHEKDLLHNPGWTVSPPEKAPGFREIKIDEEVRQALRFDEGREVLWRSSSEAGTSSRSATTNYLFFFRWDPGSASVLRARAHRPDICLPSVGWTLIADLGTKKYPGPGEISLAARHVTFKQTQGSAVAHTFFCLQEDKIHRSEARPDLLLPGGVQPEWSLPARLRVVRNGIRNPGQQVLETVLISAAAMDDETAETKFAQLIREVVKAKPEVRDQKSEIGKGAGEK